MEFHYDLLEETKAEINEMFFFKVGVQPDEMEYEVIRDFEDACMLLMSSLNMMVVMGLHGVIF